MRSKIGLLVWAALALGSVSAAAAQEAQPVDARMQIRATVLAQINVDRAQYALPPVQLDPLLNTAADYHAVEMLTGDYLSHWNTYGLKPYHRYSLFGGYHFTQENLYYHEHRGSIDTSAAGLLRLCLAGHAAFMAEKPPNDGHRRSVLNPHNTHVGIGFAASRDSFRFVELFAIAMISDFAPTERVFRGLTGIPVSGQVPEGFTVQSITVYFEDWPQPMDLRGKKQGGAYFLPNQRTDLFPVLPQGMWYSDGTRGTIEVQPGGRFQATIPFDRGPGVYTVVVWISQGQNSCPIGATQVSLFVPPY